MHTPSKCTGGARFKGRALSGPGFNEFVNAKALRPLGSTTQISAFTCGVIMAAVTGSLGSGLAASLRVGACACVFLELSVAVCFMCVSTRASIFTYRYLQYGFYDTRALEYNEC